MAIAFKTLKPITVEDIANYLLLDKVDSDKYLDLIVVGSDDSTSFDINSGYISVFLGDGKGNFDLKKTLPIKDDYLDFNEEDDYNYGIDNVVVGDFKKDNRLDLVILSGKKGTSFLGAGNGSFYSEKQFSVEYPTRFLDVGDFNNDQDLDLIAISVFKNNPNLPLSDSDSKISILLGDGKGGFDPSTEISSEITPDKLVVSNLNKDKYLDFVIGDDIFNSEVNQWQSKILVFLGNDDGNFDQKEIFPVEYDYLEFLDIGDFNNDQYLDLIAVSNEKVSIFLGDGKGNFNPNEPILVEDEIFLTSITVGDFDNDNNLDLYIGWNPDTGEEIVYLGDGKGGFDLLELTSFEELPSLIATGDINNNGLIDMVTAGPASDQIYVNLNNTDEILNEDVNTDLTISSSAATPEQVANIFATIFNDNGDGTFSYKGIYTGYEQVVMSPFGI